MSDQKTFTLDEARAMVPWLREITKTAEQQIFKTRKSVADPQQRHAALHRIIHHWAETVSKLGASPKQPFTVDFDNGTDFFCWEHPEESIYYRHGYHDGYKGRFRIEEES